MFLSYNTFLAEYRSGQHRVCGLAQHLTTCLPPAKLSLVPRCRPAGLHIQYTDSMCVWRGSWTQLLTSGIRIECKQLGVSRPPHYSNLRLRESPRCVTATPSFVWMWSSFLIVWMRVLCRVHVLHRVRAREGRGLRERSRALTSNAAGDPIAEVDCW